MNISNENVFRVKDLYLASYLFSQNISLNGIEKDKVEKFYWFIFSNSQKCERLEKDFWNRKAKVEILEYLNALRTLKQRLFQRDY